MIRKHAYKVFFLIAVLLFITSMSLTASADEYKVDPEHSFIEFRIQHLGFSWLYGRFNTVSGDFTYDTANAKVNNISVEIDVASVDTNHAERDKHLREKKFFYVKKYPTATFKSTKFDGTDKTGVLEGILNLHGVSKPIMINVQKVGEGPDPWGGYRAGFLGTITLNRSDFGITKNLGPFSETVEMELSIEGIRKK